MVPTADGRRAEALVSGSIAVLAAGSYVVLGTHVAHAPPMGIDAAARSIAGGAPPIAWVFTASCLWPVLTLFGIIGSLVAARNRVWRGRIVFAIVTTLVAWQTSDALKNVFARPRPAYWVLHRETTFAYSSGHAMFATLVYWLWAYHFARSSAPAVVRATVSGVLLVWGACVIWSRLALGAHYPTDLAGGVLLGLALLALAKTIAAVGLPNIRVL